MNLQSPISNLQSGALALALALAAPGFAATTTIPLLTRSGPPVQTNLFLLELGATTNGAYALTFSNLLRGVFSNSYGTNGLVLHATSNASGFFLTFSNTASGSLPTNNNTQLGYAGDGNLYILPGALLTNLAGQGAGTNKGFLTLEFGANQQLLLRDAGSTTNFTINATGSFVKFFATNVGASSGALWLVATNNAVVPGDDGGLLGWTSVAGNAKRWTAHLTNSVGHFTTLIATTASNNTLHLGGAGAIMYDSQVHFGPSSALASIGNYRGMFSAGSVDAVVLLEGSGTQAVILSNNLFRPLSYAESWVPMFLGTNFAPWAGLFLTNLDGTGPLLGLSNNNVILTNLTQISLSNMTATFNNNAYVFDALKMSITDTASATNSRALALLGGSSGTNVILEVFSKGSNDLSFSGGGKLLMRLHNTNTAHVASADRLSALDFMHQGDFASPNRHIIAPYALGTGVGQPVGVTISGASFGSVQLGLTRGSGAIAISNNAISGSSWTPVSDNVTDLGFTNVNYRALFATNIVNSGREINKTHIVATNVNNLPGTNMLNVALGNSFYWTNSVPGAVLYLTNTFAAAPTHNTPNTQTNFSQEITLIVSNSGAFTYTISNFLSTNVAGGVTSFVAQPISWQYNTPPTPTGNGTDVIHLRKTGVGSNILGYMLTNFPMLP